MKLIATIRCTLDASPLDFGVATPRQMVDAQYKRWREGDDDYKSIIDAAEVVEIEFSAQRSDDGE